MNIHEFGPDRSAMQGHCGLRLFFKKPTVWVTVQCSTQWSVVLRPLFIFLVDKWAQMTLFRVDWSKDLFFLFLIDKRARVVCTYPVHGGLRASQYGSVLYTWSVVLSKCRQLGGSLSGTDVL